MKKILAWVMLLTLLLGLFAGCKPVEQTPTEPSTTVSNGDIEGITAALDYLKAMYPTTEEPTPTPRSFSRLNLVRVAGVPYQVVWTTSLGEDVLHVVDNGDGTATIEVLSNPEEDTPYTLTATITDAEGNSVSHNWDMVLPKAVDMGAIVDAAYELENGESLPFEATLTGKIISIDTVYDPDYQNITVTIVVEGKEDKPIKCYRLKGDGAADLAVGNIITVTGTIKNYSGTIEFDAGCILEAVEQGDAVVAPTDPGEILKAAYALKQDTALPYPVTLTGKVTEIDTPYDPNYGNISVVIVVDGYSKYPILCYRLKGTGADQIAVNDVITVTGIIKNYKGTIEFDAGCKLLERISGGGVAEGPSSDPAKILSDAAQLKPGEKLPYRATLTGTIYSVDTPYDATYGNVTVTIVVNGKKIQCYRMVGDGADLIRETDKITVTGIIENYNGKLEFGAKCNLDSWEKGPRNVNYGPVKEDTAYTLYMNQKTVGKVVYFNGDISGNRLQTSDKGSSAIEVYGERVSGKGMRFYYLTGETKNYIEIEEYRNDSNQARGRAFVTTTPSCYWTYLSDVGVYVVTLPTAGKYFLGTYSSYETITASWSGYLESSSNPQYVAKFMAYTDIPADENADMIPQGTPVDAPAVGTPYKFGYYQNQKEGKPFLAFNGKKAGYYFGTAETMAEMVDVYLETAEGGYYIYFMNNGTKTYLDVVVRESDATKVDVAMQTSGTHTVYSLNTEYKYVYTSLAGSEWYLGTFGTNASISASKTSYISDKTTIGVSQFCAWFNNVVEVPAPEEEEPEVPTPETNATLVTQPVYGTAYKLGMNINGTIKYFTGNTTDVNFRLAISENAADAVDVYLEEVSGVNGGAYLYFMNGNTKTYIRVYQRETGDPGYGKGSLELVTSAPSEYFGWSVDANTLIHKHDDNNSYYMGTYDLNGNIYQNIAVSNASYITGNNASKIDVSQFPVHFYTVEAGEAPETTEPVTTAPSGSTDMGVVTDPVAGTAYKFGFIQENVGTDVYYITGAKSSYYMATTTDLSAAADVYLEETTGGYYLYTIVDGAKKYINMVVDGTHVNAQFEDAASTVYTYDAEKQTVVATVNDELYWHGTRNDKDYTTMGPVKVSYNGFYAKFYNAVEGDTPDVTEPEATEPEATEPETTAPSDTTEMGVVTDPVAGTAYKFGMVQENVGTDVYYITGVKDSYYMATTTDVAAAADVYLEETTDGYYLYTIVDGAKKYINMVVDGTHVNAQFEDAASTVYTFDAEKQTVVATVNDELYWHGTRNDKTFTNIGPVKVSYNGFYAKFYAEVEGGTPDVTEPETTEPEATEPEATEPVEGEGYVKITSQAQFTSGTYVMIVDTGYAPGAIDGTWLTAVQPVVSGNVVTDTAGGVWTLTVNGTSVTIADANGTFIAPKGGNYNGLATGTSYNWAWSFADGKFEFAGTGSDTVKLASNSSTTGDYPGNHRFRGYKTTTLSGQYAAEYPHQFTLYKLVGDVVVPDVTEPEATEPQPTVPSGSTLTIADAIAMGSAMAHNTYTSDKYYVTGVITEVYNTQYGNMRITDAAGNILTIYGTYSADGSDRYDAMSVKPVVGDTVTIYGVVGQYNNVAQIKNGWITEHIPAGSEPEATEPEATEPPATEPAGPVVSSNAADFDTIVTSENSGGDAKYTNSYTTADGWTTLNAAIQVGGASVVNPAYPVVGPDNTHKAVCLNGKTSALGKLTSPTLGGGISELTLVYTKMFTDTKLSVTITVTELATGNKQSHVVSRDVQKDTDKYVMWTEVWTLETPVSGEFTIEVVNNGPSASTSNKDRMTILDLTWKGAGR